MATLMLFAALLDVQSASGSHFPFDNGGQPAADGVKVSGVVRASSGALAEQRSKIKLPI